LIYGVFYFLSCAKATLSKLMFVGPPLYVLPTTRSDSSGHVLDCAEFCLLKCLAPLLRVWFWGEVTIFSFGGGGV
jgi:hypothetical protein